MNNILSAMTALGIVISIQGCADNRSVLFATKTSLGVVLDSQPPALSVAYDRMEGFIGPRLDNGAAPSVVASIKSNGAFFKAKVQQVYATGAAASLAVGGKEGNTPHELKGGSKVMFFGTTTTTGLKIGFYNLIPNSFLMGFKRMEFSLIPLGKSSDTYTYPSTYAMIDTTGLGVSQSSSGLSTGQFFATGVAAEKLASLPQTQNLFRQLSISAIQSYRAKVAQQDAEITRILKCYAGVAPSDLPKAWENANDLQLFYDTNTYTELLQWQNATIANINHDNDLIKANRRYANEISNTSGTDPARARLLAIHRKDVCALARKKK